VSSGAFVAAGLANGISTSEMHAIFILDRSHHDPFEPDLLLRPAFGEFARRLDAAARTYGYYSAAADYTAAACRA
jgi:NTE family protein